MIYACCCLVCSGATQTASSVQSAYALDASLVRTIFPAAPVATIITSPVSGDSRIDALLIDSNVRLNNAAAPGTPITLTYSFPARLPFVYTGEDALGWRAFTAQQQSAVRSVLNVLEQQIGITFVEVADTRSVGGTMRFSNNVQSGSAGYAYLANGNGSGVDIESDVFISSRYTTNVTQGSYAWTTLVHEIGQHVRVMLMF